MRKEKIPLLYHFTCDHGYTGILKTGTIIPHMHPLMRYLGPLLWLTDLAQPPTPESVGLTSTILACDRMAHRFIVQSKSVLAWFDLRARVDHDVLATLEAYGQPHHWYIVRRPLTSTEFSLDKEYQKGGIYGEKRSS